MQRGFIQIPILIVIILGTFVVGGGGYFGVKTYQKKTEEKRAEQRAFQQREEQLVELQAKLNQLIDRETATSTSTTTEATSEVDLLRKEIEGLKKGQTASKTATKTTTPSPTPVPEKIVEVKPVEPPKSVKVLTTAEMVKLIKPSVVLVQTSDGGHGSGFIIESGGVILTNAHVVRGFSSATVKFNGQVALAQVIGRDELIDVALLRIEKVGLITVEMGDSSEEALQQGDQVYAFGYPQDLTEGDASLTGGLVSARRVQYGNTYIQTDASIHPGNSGGPLLNSKGQVVGINTLSRMTFGMDLDRMGGTGLAFAIPINIIRGIIPDLKNGRYVTNPAWVTPSPAPTPTPSPSPTPTPSPTPSPNPTPSPTPTPSPAPSPTPTPPPPPAPVLPGSISATVDASSPVTTIVVSGSMPKIASFKFSSQNDTYTITELSFDSPGSQAIANLVLKDGATTIATTAFGTQANITGLSVTVPANTSKVIDVYAQLGTVGSGGATSGTGIQVQMFKFKSRNSNGVEATETVNLSGSYLYVYKTKLTISNVALPSTTLSAGTQTIAKFTLSADSAGPIAWRKLILHYSKSGDFTLSNVAVYDSANESTPLAATEVSSTDSSITLSSTQDNQVAGSKTYVVKATLSGQVMTGNSLSTGIQGGTSYSPSTDAQSVINSGATFVWSDQSALPHSENSPDWSGDYLVKNLPTDSQTLSK